MSCKLQHIILPCFMQSVFIELSSALSVSNREPKKGLAVWRGLLQCCRDPFPAVANAALSVRRYIKSRALLDDQFGRMISSHLPSIQPCAVLCCVVCCCGVCSICMLITDIYGWLQGCIQAVPILSMRTSKVGHWQGHFLDPGRYQLRIHAVPRTEALCII